MATAEHKHPNYMAIFWYLAGLTVIEIGRASCRERV